MTGNPIAWFEIYVNDMPRAKRFYESVFQTTLTALSAPMDSLEMWAFPSDMNSYGAGGALCHIDGCAGGSGTLVYFHCEDCAVEEARAVAAGAQVHRSKFAIGEFGFISLVVDSEGNLIGLHSMA